MALLPGDTIDRYVIEALLGAGGMGEVYRARDPRLHRSVALKILRADAAGSLGGGTGPTDGAARMMREARAAAALDHPNVVAVFDVGQIEGTGPLAGTTFLAMELIKGRPLSALIAEGAAPMRERVRWLTDVAKALGAAHEAGLVHRDVKPDNVMVRDDGVVKVLDFGIARRTRAALSDAAASTAASGEDVAAMATVTAQGVVIGTPLYMAPEQMRGEPLDGRADQFSWGVVAYELLTGALPWSRDGGSIALLAQVLSSKPPSLDAFVDIPDALKITLLRTLEKDRDARFTTMREVVDAIEGRPYSGNSGQPVPTNDSRRTGPAPGASAPVTRRSGEGGEAFAATELVSRHPSPAPTGPTSLASQGGAPVKPFPLVVPMPSPARSPWRAFVATGGLLVGVGAIAGALAWRAHRSVDATAAPVTSAPSVVAPVAGCVGDRACTKENGGAPAVCRASDRTCAPIASQDCTPKFDPRDLERDDTVWVGAMFPLTGALAAAFGQMNANGVELARSEISEATRSLADETSAQHVRRVAVVLCNDADDPMRAAKHLVDDVGVPAIVGFKSGQEIVDIAGSFLTKKGVLTLASLTSSPLITKLPQPAGMPRMVWRTTFSLDAVARAAAQMIPASLEAKLPKRDGLVRVAVVRADHAAGLAFFEAFFDALVLNGHRVTEDGRSFSELRLAVTPTDAEIHELTARLLATQPSLVVVAGSSEATVKILQELDGHWPSSAGTPPTYLIVSESTEPLWPWVGDRAERRRRIFAITSVSDSPRNARFVIRYNERFTPAVSRTFNPGVSYDAFYLAAYGAFASTSHNVTGTGMGRAFERLMPPGREIEVGPTGVFDALSTLGSGGRVDLQGVETDLDFDIARGEAPSDFALVCIEPGADGRPSSEIESGLVFRARTGVVEGELRCR